MFSLNVIFFAFLAIRLATLRISIRNEKRLIQQGAVQYGKKNSLLLSVAHIAFYASASSKQTGTGRGWMPLRSQAWYCSFWHLPFCFT